MMLPLISLWKNCHYSCQEYSKLLKAVLDGLIEVEEKGTSA